jgi:hypothetical protein
MLNYPPYRDNIIDGDKPQKVTETWLDWIKQIPATINFVSPLFAGNQTASIDMTVKPGIISPWPGFLILSYSTVASPLTITLPVAPRNSLVIVARPAAGASALTINGTYVLAASTWIALISDGTNWNKIMGGNL